MKASRKRANKAILSSQIDAEKERFHEACFGCQINCATARVVKDHWANHDEDTRDEIPKYTFNTCPKTEQLEKLKIKKKKRFK